MIWIIVSLIAVVTATILSRPLWAQSKGVAIVVFATITVGSLGLYAALGEPALSNPDNLIRQTQSEPTSAPEGQSLESLVAQLEARLDQNPGETNGWLILARSRMTLRRYEAALDAYDRALALTNNNTDFVLEKERAQNFINAQSIDAAPGPTQDQVEAATQMSDADRQVMIEGMVEGLATRLYESPDDPEGWVRLLRARQVLGQSDQLEKDITLVRETFAGREGVVEQILSNLEDKE